MSNVIPRALALLFVGGLWACSNSDLPVAPSVGTSAGSGSTSGVTASFKSDVQPLLASSCAGCHAAGQEGESDLLLFKNGGVDYSAASGSISKIVRETSRGSMPKGRSRLTSAQMAVLQAWQAAGAPNN